MTNQAMVVDVSSDWAIACDVQQRFMQHSSPALHALSYGARCRQVRALGGDFYDFLPLPGQGLAFAIGDASGKSVAAALMIANVQSSLRTAASFAGNEPAALLHAVNRVVSASFLSGRYATLFYGVYDGTARKLRYVNAGHNPPAVLHRDGSITWLETAGAPVGMFPDWAYTEDSVQLAPGDRVVAYTDGVTEAENPAREEWRGEGLLQAAAASNANRADDIVDAIFVAMDEFSQGRQSDDATVVVLQVE